MYNFHKSDEQHFLWHVSSHPKTIAHWMELEWNKNMLKIAIWLAKIDTFWSENKERKKNCRSLSSKNEGKNMFTVGGSAKSSIVAGDALWLLFHVEAMMEWNHENVDAQINGYSFILLQRLRSEEEKKLRNQFKEFAS